MTDAAIEFATAMTILAALEAAVFSAMTAVVVAAGLLYPWFPSWAVVSAFGTLAMISAGLAGYWYANPMPLKTRIRGIVVKYHG